MSPRNKSLTWQWVIQAGHPYPYEADRPLNTGRPLNTDRLYETDKRYGDNQDVLVTPNQRGLAYGDGFFTTMAVCDGKVLWQAEHACRVQSHAQALKLELSDQSITHLWSKVTKAAMHIGEGILKLIVSRQPQPVRGYAFVNSSQGESSQGVSSQNNNSQDCHDSSSVNGHHYVNDHNHVNDRNQGAHIWLGTTQVSLYDSAIQHPNAEPNLDLYDVDFHAPSIPIQPPITAICLTAKLSILPPTLVGLKTLNRLDNVMAAGELEQYKHELGHNQDFKEYAIGEGMVSNVSGQWIEGVMSNVYYQLGDVNGASLKGVQDQLWYTPPLDKSGVDGVMRQVIIDRVGLSTVGQARIVERVLEDKDLACIEALFFCNAVRGVIPVAQLLLPHQSAVKRLQLRLPAAICRSSVSNFY